MELLPGILLGFLGSFHCIGMCGPLVIALPRNRRFMLQRLIHHLGRVTTYVLLGLIFGLVGSRLYLAGLQQVISISLGGLILIIVVLPVKVKTAFLKLTGFDKFLHLLTAGISKLYRSGSITSSLGIGLLNGFLPCGFVYIALTGALAIGNVTGSSLFMLMFGLGTIPAMLAVSLAAKKAIKIFSVNFRNKFKRLIPAFSVAIALIFILRGLNLGIPYISPKLENKFNATEQLICH